MDLLKLFRFPSRLKASSKFWVLSDELHRLFHTRNVEIERVFHKTFIVLEDGDEQSEHVCGD
ncbi:hypothetical protein M378DRAFT_798259 [Amanita muscaria Koide BX008]|uniref:Uncharacterized protein n=1 Tax=Amanita muscaria (strain Koide BX008) TaxID=946122 RepID=A0A0C2SGJ9_AMAMK|nr:hypothetical protein M378DRAFT_798259 [Amanita muscaria Koide BX008]